MSSLRVQIRAKGDLAERLNPKNRNNLWCALDIVREKSPMLRSTIWKMHALIVEAEHLKSKTERPKDDGRCETEREQVESERRKCMVVIDK